MNKIEILKNVTVFNGLGDSDLEEIVPLLDQVSYPEGSTIIKEGTTGHTMYIIISGTVKVTKTDEKKIEKETGAEEVLICFLYAGSYFGELSLIDNMPRSANVISLEPTEMLRLHRSDFDELLHKNKNIAITFYHNCLKETFGRFRNIISNFTFFQHVIHEKSSTLNEITKDISLAKKVQEYFINIEDVESDNSFPSTLRSSYIYSPCSGVGGDFLNFVKVTEGTLGIMIADVVGHGIPAALATGVLKSAFQIFVRQCGLFPEKLMEEMNNHYFRITSELYSTAYYALIDTNEMKMKVTKAGHHHPIFWKKSTNDFFVIESPGIGLGIIEDAKYEPYEVDIEPGDKILFFTDGIIEQRNEQGEMYTQSRLTRKFKEFIEKGEPKIIDMLKRDFRNYHGKMKQEDDITFLLVEI